MYSQCKWNEDWLQETGGYGFGIGPRDGVLKDE